MIYITNHCYSPIPTAIREMDQITVDRWLPYLSSTDMLWAADPTTSFPRNSESLDGVTLLGCHSFPRIIITGKENIKTIPQNFCILWMAVLFAVIFAIAIFISLVMRIICPVRILMIFLPFNSTIEKTQMTCRCFYGTVTLFPEEGIPPL